MKNETPKVSVIIPVYNGEKFVRDAINSILGQTFQNFELIIINDGSNDASKNIIASYNDPRIVFINNDINTGLPSVRNQGLEASHGQYIAWLDCDDISMSDRLEKQVKFLDGNLQAGVCGAWIEILDNTKGRIVQFPINPKIIRAELLFNNCLANSTIMMRAACTRELGLRFNLSHHLSQDYGFWVRIPKNWEITNIPEVMTIYRFHSSQVTTVYKEKQVDISWEIQKEQLLKLDVTPTERERFIHMGLGGLIQNIFEDSGRLFATKDYLIKLDNANIKHKIYDKKALRQVLLQKWQIASASHLSSKKMGLISYWLRFKFGNFNFDLLWRIVKKISRNFVDAIKQHSFS